MPPTDNYISLITSLPSSERLFVAKLPPISRLKLEKRLKQMAAEDLAILRDIEAVLDWRMQHIELDDAVVIKQAKSTMMKVTSETLQTLVREKLELRTCITAIRKKKNNEPAPNNTEWGIGRWVGHINRHWNEAQFGLGKSFPWLAEAEVLIQKDDAEGLERLILEQAFKQLKRYSTLHHFDLEAVVIYVLKWNIIDRGSRYNTEAAKKRFNDLVEEGLADFTAPLFEDKS
jgi:hypothetical protein